MSLTPDCLGVILSGKNWHPNWHRTGDDGPVQGGIANGRYPRKSAENRDHGNTRDSAGRVVPVFETVMEFAPNSSPSMKEVFFTTCDDVLTVTVETGESSLPSLTTSAAT